MTLNDTDVDAEPMVEYLASQIKRSDEVNSSDIKSNDTKASRSGSLSDQGEGFKIVDHELEAAESGFGRKVIPKDGVDSGGNSKDKIPKNPKVKKILPRTSPPKDGPVIAASISTKTETKIPKSGPLGINKDKVEKHSFGYKVTIYRSPGTKGKRGHVIISISNYLTDQISERQGKLISGFNDYLI